MNFQSLTNFFSPVRPWDYRDAARATQYSIFRDSFKLTTWLALGACLQALLSYLLPPAFAVAPVSLLLTYRVLRPILAHQSLIRHKQMDGVFLGKHTVQSPLKDGGLSANSSENAVAILILAARSNHALGIFGPGYRDVSLYINGMIEDLWKNANDHGFLGQTTWIAANERYTNNQVMVLCYFRSMEHLHRYAHGSLHSKAWRWWNRTTAKHPHLSIMHEMYHAPKGHWENIFINNHMTGIASPHAMANVPENAFWPLVDASQGSLRTQTGRLGRGDGNENEGYGPVPYQPAQ